ncbi:unnamed protein product [Clonostachys rhizophaga]|uniref:Uncharacterized protein n=1 Tax=Clonostachys rhizophaga TaxID=160324 RepID=A0A9N9W461_9HYPO|nr:unnamed protein product [Clonostachys rhizophaga]
MALAPRHGMADTQKWPRFTASRIATKTLDQSLESLRGPPAAPPHLGVVPYVRTHGSAVCVDGQKRSAQFAGSAELPRRACVVVSHIESGVGWEQREVSGQSAKGGAYETHISDGLRQWEAKNVGAALLGRVKLRAAREKSHQFPCTRTSFSRMDEHWLNFPRVLAACLKLWIGAAAQHLLVYFPDKDQMLQNAPTRGLLSLQERVQALVQWICRYWQWGHPLPVPLQGP